MGSTSRGYTFPASTDHTRLWEHIETLAEDVDADISALMAALGTYTPVLSATTTNPTMGTSTLAGSYIDMGHLVMVRTVITIASGFSAGSGVYRVSLPVAPKVNSLISATFFDQSASQYYPGHARCTLAATTGDNMRIGLAGSAAQLGAAAPVVPASGDIIILHGMYEKN
jgi:hypothetical protein